MHECKSCGAIDTRISNGDNCICTECGTPDDFEEVEICGRCYDSVDEVFEPNCNEKPEKLLGQPLGQYRCPDCGAMVVAGIEHPYMCKQCIDKEHPNFD